MKRHFYNVFFSAYLFLYYNLIYFSLYKIIYKFLSVITKQEKVNQHNEYHIVKS